MQILKHKSTEAIELNQADSGQFGLIHSVWVFLASHLGLILESTSDSTYLKKSGVS